MHRGRSSQEKIILGRGVSLDSSLETQQHFGKHDLSSSFHSCPEDGSKNFLRNFIFIQKRRHLPRDTKHFGERVLCNSLHSYPENGSKNFLRNSLIFIPKRRHLPGDSNRYMPHRKDDRCQVRLSLPI